MTEKRILFFFRISLILKAIIAAAEIIFGILLLAVSAFAGLIMLIFPVFPAGFILFGAAYLLVHGIAKIILIINVFRKKLWAYPAIIVFISLFMVYEAFRLLFTGSLFMLVLIALDIVTPILTVHEYKIQKKDQ